MTRHDQLKQIGALQALAMTADSTEDYLRWFAKETNLRAELEPLNTYEQRVIAREARERIAEYEYAEGTKL